MTINSSDTFPTVFNNDFRAINKHQYTEYCEKGGRGSCKSSFISLCVIILMQRNPNFNALIFRKVADTLRDSVYEQLLWAIDVLGLGAFFKATTSPMQISHKQTGQRIVFRGADKPEKVKSIKLKKGYFAITWFEEVTEFTLNDVRTLKLSAMRGGNLFWVFYSFNPPSSRRNIWNDFFKRSTKTMLVHRTDYRTVPKHWLGDAFLQEAENLKKRNRRAYENIFLGKETGTGLNIFDNITSRKITDEEIDRFDFIYHGVDWGYYPDPLMYVGMSFDARKQTLYIFDELRLLKHGNYQAHSKLKKHMEDHGFNIAKDRITADSAEPKSVADFRSWGANMRGALKGKGSLDAGFKWLQQLKEIVIDPDRCPHANDEFSLYEHELDKKTGEIMGGYPQGQPDHAMAAVRYAMESTWRKAGQ